jgi:hypothetical protein
MRRHPPPSPPGTSSHDQRMQPWSFRLVTDRYLVRSPPDERHACGPGLRFCFEFVVPPTGDAAYAGIERLHKLGARGQPRERSRSTSAAWYRSIAETTLTDTMVCGIPSSIRWISCDSEETVHCADGRGPVIFAVESIALSCRHTGYPTKIQENGQENGMTIK